MRFLYCLLCILCLSLSLGQLCLTDLRHGLDETDLAESATGTEAATLLHQAVNLLEPDLPPFLYSPLAYPVEPLDPSFDSVKFLLERQLLPATWEAQTLTPEVWEDMLSRVARWYNVAAPAITGTTKADITQSLATLIQQVSPRLRGVALIATAQHNRDEVAFWAIIRNDSIFPRLIVYRPPTGAPLAGIHIRDLLPRLGNCAQTITNYVHAPEDTARRLFTGNNNGQMIIASTSPVRMDGFTYVPQGEESNYLTFNTQALEAFSSYAAVFEGGSANPLLVTRLLPQVRTNMNPRELLGFLFPERF
jgi:hypothetical protein